MNDARKWLLQGGGGHEDGVDGLRALTVSGEGLVEFLEAYGEFLAEREAAAVQARDRQWCSELAKHDVAARAMYPGGIEIEVPTIAEAVETAREARLAEAEWWHAMNDEGNDDLRRASCCNRIAELKTALGKD